MELLSVDEWRQRFAHKRRQSLVRMRAFYSSYVGGITKDIELMTLPLDDHMVHRGHGVYESGSILKGRPLQLNVHLTRLFESASHAGIRLEPRFTKAGISDIIQETIRVSDCVDNACYRVYISTGPGSFGIHSDECEEVCIYVIVYESQVSYAPIPEKTVSCEIVPMKHPKMSSMKAVDYLQNALMADYAKAHGGTFGIWIDEHNNVKEGSIVSVLIVTDEGRLCTPSKHGILAGSTVAHIAELISRNKSIGAGVEYSAISLNQLYSAREVMLLGADIVVHPVVSIDGQKIGNGQMGAVTRYVVENLNKSYCYIGSLGVFSFFSR